MLYLIISASEHSLVLKEIDVPLWNHDNCNGALQAQFGPAYSLPDTTICAGAEGHDACDVSILINLKSCFSLHSTICFLCSTLKVRSKKV